MAGLTWLEGKIGIELEFNPFSKSSRAARAQRAGRIADAFRLRCQSGDIEGVRRCLAQALPESKQRSTILAASAQLIELQTALSHIRPSIIPAPMVTWFLEQITATRDALSASTERLAAVAALRQPGSDIETAMQAQSVSLERMLKAIGEVRAEFAKLALSGETDSLNAVERGFHGLAQASDRLREEQASD